VDATGLIFAVIVIIWLFYLVPQRLFQRHDSDEAYDGPDDEGSLIIYRNSGHPEQATVVDKGYSVSTKHMRRTLRRYIRLHAYRAAIRRRWLLLGLVVMTLTVTVLVAVGVFRWWAIMVSLASIIGWMFFAHWDTQRANNHYHNLIAEIDLSDDELTVAVPFHSPMTTDTSVAIQPPRGSEQSLWDPIPIVGCQTYVSQPKYQRTIRHIPISTSPESVRAQVARPADDVPDQRRTRANRSQQPPENGPDHGTWPIAV
jgi:hypothetical protein